MSALPALLAPLLALLLLPACADLPPAPPALSEPAASAPPLFRLPPPEPPAEPPPAEPAPTRQVLIADEPAPVDPASDAFRDIAAYAGFNDNMLRDEIARIEALPETGNYLDLRLAVLLWMSGRPEHSARLDALAARLGSDEDQRVVALAGMIARAISSQRGRSERIAALEAQLADAQRRVEQLRAKIDALKSLEKELLSRPEPRPDAPEPRRPPPRP